MCVCLVLVVCACGVVQAYTALCMLCVVQIDFTMCSGLLFALVMVLFFFGWATLITYYVWGYNRVRGRRENVCVCVCVGGGGGHTEWWQARTAVKT